MITTSELTWPTRNVPSLVGPRTGHDLSGTIVSIPTNDDELEAEAGFSLGDEVFALTAFKKDGSAAD